jgi:two-component system, LuxR family, response regulator FixJ
MSRTVTKRASSPVKAAKATAAPAIPLGDAEKMFGLSVAVARERHARLTPREIQVAGLMSTGKRNQQIAEELGISPKTLDIHRANLMQKLEARTTADVANLVNLIRFAELAATFGS